jgi:hypothetical protein
MNVLTNYFISELSVEKKRKKARAEGYEVILPTLLTGYNRSEALLKGGLSDRV